MNKLLFKLYNIPSKKVKRLVLSAVFRLENGYLYSDTIREIFKYYHGVEIGKYSMGGCFVPFLLDRNTTVGRYCSLSMTCKVLNRNHPMDYKSMHGFFFNPRLGIVEKDNVEYIPLNIGHDVWIGHNAIIMPNVQEIGTGAVIAAGAVVNKNLPPYCVAVGNPARIVRYRFEPDIIQSLLDSTWWEKDIEELKNELHDFKTTYKPRSLHG